MHNPTILNLAASLYLAREKLAQARQLTDVLEREFQEQHRTDFEKLADARATVRQVEAELRTRAVEIATATGERHLAPGVEVKQRKKVEYTEPAAMSWAMKTGMALTLDASTFQKLVLAAPDSFDGVASVVEVPFTSIADNLIDAALLVDLPVTTTQETPTDDNA